MSVKAKQSAGKRLLDDKILRASDEKFCSLAESTPSATFVCWAERLLLLGADRELHAIRRGVEKTPRR